MYGIERLPVVTHELAARIVQLQRAAYAVEAELIGFDGIPPLHDTADDVMALELDWVAAFEGGELVGGLGYSDDGPIREIDRLFVDPAHARRGIGKALVMAAIADGRTTVSTGTANVPAVSLYEGLGFTRLGERAIAPDVTITEFELRRS